MKNKNAVPNTVRRRRFSVFATFSQPHTEPSRLWLFIAAVRLYASGRALRSLCPVRVRQFPLRLACLATFGRSHRLSAPHRVKVPRFFISLPLAARSRSTHRILQTAALCWPRAKAAY